MKTLRILHVITGLTSGGAETMLCRLLESLPPPRFEHSVVALGSEGVMSARVSATGARLVHLNLSRHLPNPAGLFRLAGLIREVKPNVIQGWMYHGNIASMAAARLAGVKVPIIWGVRASLDGYGEYRLGTRVIIQIGKKMSGKPWRIIYNSEVARTQHTHFGYSSTNADVIPNGIDCEEFKPNPQARACIRQDLAIPEGAPVIGLFARYDPMKDHRGFLLAARRLSGSEPEARFILAGENVDGKNLVLRRMLQDLDLSTRVFLLGERADCNDLMAAADVVTSCSSYAEGFPNAVAEAMACAVPCVVTEVGDSAYIVGDTGRVISPRNPAALSDAWLSLIRESGEVRRARGKAARERVSGLFELGSITRKYAALYQLAQTRGT